jgi:Protein of unknown function (DUF3606)
MPANKKKVGKADRSKVAGGETYEVQYAAKKFGATPTDVKNAIKKVGNSRTALTKHFRGK